MQGAHAANALSVWAGVRLHALGIHDLADDDPLAVKLSVGRWGQQELEGA